MLASVKSREYNVGEKEVMSMTDTILTVIGTVVVIGLPILIWLTKKGTNSAV